MKEAVPRGVLLLLIFSSSSILLLSSCHCHTLQSPGGSCHTVVSDGVSPFLPHVDSGPRRWVGWICRAAILSVPRAWASSNALGRKRGGRWASACARSRPAATAVCARAGALPSTRARWSALAFAGRPSYKTTKRRVQAAGSTLGWQSIIRRVTIRRWL